MYTYNIITENCKISRSDKVKFVLRRLWETPLRLSCIICFHFSAQPPSKQMCIG